MVHEAGDVDSKTHSSKKNAQFKLSAMMTPAREGLPPGPVSYSSSLAPRTSAHPVHVASVFPGGRKRVRRR